MEKKLPIGIEDFAKIRQESFYYIDKMGFIWELLLRMGWKRFWPMELPDVERSAG